MSKLTLCKNLSAALILSTCLSTAAVAGQSETKRAVIEHQGSVVRSIESGTCVRTKWDGAQAPCAPQQAETSEPPMKIVEPVEKPAPMPAPTPEPEPMTMHTDSRSVYFASNQHALTSDAKRTLDALPSERSANIDVQHVQITGYADRMGSNEYNQKLSRKRAVTVAEYMAGKGYLDAEHIDVTGMGEEHPITSCNASMNKAQLIACLQPDRRVDVKVQYYQDNRYLGY